MAKPPGYLPYFNSWLEIRSDLEQNKLCISRQAFEPARFIRNPFSDFRHGSLWCCKSQKSLFHSKNHLNVALTRSPCLYFCIQAQLRRRQGSESPAEVSSAQPFKSPKPQAQLGTPGSRVLPSSVEKEDR